MEEQKAAARRQLREKLDQETRVFMLTPEGITMIKNTASRIMLEMRNTDGTIDGVRNKAAVLQTAKDRVAEEYVSHRRQLLMFDMQRLEDETEDRIQERGIQLKSAMARMLRDVNLERLQLRQQIKELRGKQSEELQARMRIAPEVFKVAVPQSRICEHIRSRTWGNEYGKGIKCLNCGKELTEIDKEDSQRLGYGSGTERWLYEAIKQHRENESSYRFKTAEELRIVEEERRRLEKERRDMEESNVYFHDFEQMRVLYDFDRRHANEIKPSGIFRQGLQWTFDEVRNDCH
jgi:hypothetical protein